MQYFLSAATAIPYDLGSWKIRKSTYISGMASCLSPKAVGNRPGNVDRRAKIHDEITLHLHKSARGESHNRSQHRCITPGVSS